MGSSTWPKKSHQTPIPARLLESGGLHKGQVRNVRELARGVQATVSLGYLEGHGSASVTLVSHSLAVYRALDALKTALRDEAEAIVRPVEEGGK